MKKLFLTLLAAVSVFTATAQVLADGYYVIRYAENPEYVLTVTNYNVGKEVVVYEWGDRNTQIWKVENRKNGAVSIRTSDTHSHSLDVANNKMANNVKVVLSQNERQWLPERQSNGSYVLMVKENKNFCLDLMNGISNAKNNGVVQIWQTHKGAQQQWVFERVDNKPPVISEGIYAIRLKSTPNLAITLKNDRCEAGNEVVSYSWKNKDTQKWKVSHEKDGTIALRSVVNPNMVIQMQDDKVGANAIVIRQWNGGAAQRWKPKWNARSKSYMLKHCKDWVWAIKLGAGIRRDNGPILASNSYGTDEEQWELELLGKWSSGNNGSSSSNSGSNATPNKPSTTVLQDPGNMTSYRGKNGSVYTFRVTGASGGRIWGGEDNIYTDDSNLATAAVHAGVLKVGQTGEVKVKILADQGSYPSITRNGITSIKYGSWNGSFQIMNGSGSSTTTSNKPSSSSTTSSKPSTTVLQDPGNMTSYRGKNGSVYTFRVTGASGGRIWGGEDNIYTDDSNLATAAVHAGVLKVGQTGEVKVKILADQGSYPSITRNGITSIKYGSWNGSFQIMNGSGSSTTTSSKPSSSSTTSSKPSSSSTTSSKPSTTALQDPGNMSSYRGKNGSVYTFRVTGASGGRIWGGEDNIYTDDSNLATAAVHAGVLKVGQTGEVKVKILANQSSYPSITRNGITSIKYGSWNGSFQIMNGSGSSTTTSSKPSSSSTTSSKPSTTVLQDPGNMTGYRGKNGSVYTFRVTGASGGRIWGGEDNIYTDDSNLATAAVHAGVLKVRQTGEVKVKILANQSSYPSITRNGITSIKYGSWNGSFQIVK